MKTPQKIENKFGQALRKARKHKGLSQEAFGLHSSRTYISTLERGLKSPTLSKIGDIAAVLQIHPLTLLAMTYAEDLTLNDIEKTLELIKIECQQFGT